MNSLTIELHDGTKLNAGALRFARGNAMLPLREADLEAKFLDCTAGFEDFDAEDLYQQLARLRERRSVGTLGRVDAIA